MDETHPEYRCQRCGGRNPVWNVDSDRYNTAVNRSEIVCPTCFVLAHEAATGMCTVWQLAPMVPFRWIDDEGRPTPYLQSGEAGSGNAPTPAPSGEAGSVLPSPPLDAGAPPPPTLREMIEGYLIEHGWDPSDGSWNRAPYRLRFEDAVGRQMAVEQAPPAESQVEELMDTLAKSVDAAKAARIARGES